jgi:predicted DNA-binding transcriptional regulator AlpA
MTTPRPAWTLTEAAERTGASRSTLRRYRDAGKFPGAYKDASGAWRFPHEDLLAAGLSFATPPREQPSEQGQDRITDHPVSRSVNREAEQVAQLEQALREERARADSAERLAASYRENLDDVRRALRMLEAGTSQPERPADQVQTKVSEQAGEQPSPREVNHPRSWWTRFTGARRQ